MEQNTMGPAMGDTIIGGSPKKSGGGLVVIIFVIVLVIIAILLLTSKEITVNTVIPNEEESTLQQEGINLSDKDVMEAEASMSEEDDVDSLEADLEASISDEAGL